MAMKLVYEKTKAEVCVGDYATTWRGETVQVEGIRAPLHSGSTGRVLVREVANGMAVGPELDFYPSIICAVWVDESEVVKPCEDKP